MSASRASPAPLQTGMLGNVQAKTNSFVSLLQSGPLVLFFSGLFNQFSQKIKTESSVTPKPDDSSNMENLLARMREMQVKDNQQNGSSTSTVKDHSKGVMDKLIADLKLQNGELKKQELDNKGESDSDTQKEEDRSSASDPFTPATESFDVGSSADQKAPAASSLSATEMMRVKQELAAAKTVITRQEQELAESRNLKHTIDQAMGPASEADFGSRADMNDMNEETIHHLQGAFNATARPFTARANSWLPQEDSRSDNSDGPSAGGNNRGRGIWNGPGQQAYGVTLAQPMPQQTNLMDNRNAHGAWPPLTGMQAGHGAVSANQRLFSGPSVPTYGFEGRFGFGDDGSQFNPGGMRRATSQYNRPGTGYNNRAGPFGGGLGAGLSALATTPMTALGLGGPVGYQPRPIGSPLSPTASEFTGNSLPTLGNAWPQVSFSVLDTGTF